MEQAFPFQDSSPFQSVPFLPAAFPLLEGSRLPSWGLKGKDGLLAAGGTVGRTQARFESLLYFC
jgi:hypothetical protein